jgi:hypothetical protein
MEPNAEHTKLAEQIANQLNLKTEMGRTFVASFLELALLFDKKQQDYGSTNISSTGELGVMVRTQDKVSRIRNLLTKEMRGQGVEGAQNEPLEDSWKDMANYGVIGLMLRRGLWR